LSRDARNPYGCHPGTLGRRARASVAQPLQPSPGMQDDTETTNALELLRSQHEEVDELISQIENSEDHDEKTDLFEKLADRIAAHSTIEEKLFYPSMVAKQTRELLLEFTEEHLAAKRLLADMLELDVEDEHFDAKLAVLKEELRHHAHDEEEDKLFPECEKIASEDELAALGGEMLAMYEEIIDEQPRNRVPDETVAAAPL
jgi:hemerythrin superfamily protein